MKRKNKHEQLSDERDVEEIYDFEKLTKLEKAGDDVTYLTELAKTEKRFFSQHHFYGNLFQENTATTRLDTEQVNPLMAVIANRDFRCDCIKKLSYVGLHVTGNVSGPPRDRDFFLNGFIGAVRQSVNEYTVTNHGPAYGKTRIPMNGNLELIHQLEGLNPGSYYILLENLKIRISGNAAILGNGNVSTSYDARVKIEFLSMMSINGAVIYQNGKDIHFDQTRSEFRNKRFLSDFVFVPQAIRFEIQQENQTIQWLNRLHLHTAANSEGYVGAFADCFGFEATTGPEQLDLVVIKS